MAKTIIITSFLLVLLTKTTVERSPRVNTGLYDDNDLVHVLTTDNFEASVYGKDTAVLVEFYASWCGHCQQFAPKFKRFAKDIVPWSGVLRVAAINCGDERNVEICRELNVNELPSLRIFGKGASKKEQGILLDLYDFTVPAVREEVAKALAEYAVKTKPTGWPSFTPLFGAKKQDLVGQVTFDEKPVLVIVENRGSAAASEVILDMSAYQKFVTIKRIAMETHPMLVHSLLPDATILPPALLKISQGKSGDIEVVLLESAPTPRSDMRDVFVKRIVADFLGNEYSSVAPFPVRGNSALESGSKQSSKVETTKEGETVPVHYTDLYNALRYALYHEVLLHKKYNATQVDALRRFFSVLNAYFPFDNENPRRFVKRMSQWFHDNRNATESKDLHAIMRAGSEGYLPTMRPYISCYSKAESKRGYTCGLWLLFHTLVANEYTKTRPDTAIADYHSVLFAMRAYVKNFFVCSHCAREFTNMSSNLENELKFPNSSVLWLWEAHNKVNQRLAGDVTEDKDHPKIQFPSYSSCPDCYKSQDVWDRTGVLKFLLNHYHKANIVRSSPSSAAINSPFILIILTISLSSTFIFR